jgi:phytoene dehydrogenase-like protein
VRALARALVRLSTYSADERLLARAALAQLNLAIAGNVFYLDGGWQTLVDGLRAAATAAGVRIVTGEKVTPDILAERTARATILAVAPAVARSWVPVAELEPVRASCLDLALRPGQLLATFGLGIDQPHYVSVHSAAAELGPGDVIHAMRYGGGGTRDELERLVDAVAPGWQERVVHARFLPDLTVTHALVSARRPDCAAAPDVFLCGDWVGDTGMLVDAALASARRAAALACERVVERTAA